MDSLMAIMEVPEVMELLVHGNINFKNNNYEKKFV